MEDALCPNCGEYVEGAFDPSECPNLQNLKWGGFF